MGCNYVINDNRFELSLKELKSVRHKQKNKNILNSIKSIYILKQILDNIHIKKSFEIIKYNKNIQNVLDISLNDYKNLTDIEIDIIPNKKGYKCKCNFINIVNEEDKKYFHIYFNNKKEEIKRDYIEKDEENIRKIKVIINYQVKSFYKLFDGCQLLNQLVSKNFIILILLI